MAAGIPTVISAPGTNNVYIPGTSDLIIGYSRNENDYAVNQYSTLFPVENWVGFWLKFDPKDVVRVPYADGRNFLFPDGQPRPIGTNNWTNSRLGWLQYQLQRYSFNGSLGQVTIAQAAFDAKKKILDDLAAKAMTQRSRLAVTALLDSAQYATNHVATATAWSNNGGTGGFWSAGTVANPIIGRSLQAIRNQILKDTNGKVKPKDLCLIVNPDAAYKMSQSQEIRAYLSNQVGSLKVLEGSDPSMENDWGLPNPLYGFKVIVEDANYVADLPDADPSGDTSDFVFDGNKAVVVARPGTVNGEAGGKAFSTLHCLFDKSNEMVVETFDKPEHKLVDFYISMVLQYLVVAPETGALVTNLFS